jgi:hypothetical protein
MNNIARWERVIRFVVGIGILAFVPRTAWAWLGVIPLLTGLFGYCPVYHLLGVSTVRKPKAI